MTWIFFQLCCFCHILRNGTGFSRLSEYHQLWVHIRGAHVYNVSIGVLLDTIVAWIPLATQHHPRHLLWLKKSIILGLRSMNNQRANTHAKEYYKWTSWTTTDSRILSKDSLLRDRSYQSEDANLWQHVWLDGRLFSLFPLFLLSHPLAGSPHLVYRRFRATWRQEWRAGRSEEICM